MTRSIIPMSGDMLLITRQSVAAGKKDQLEEPYGFLCFTLGDEEYGVDLNLVCQVLKPPPLTWVPRLEKHILGVVSIRGAVVTLVDLRQLIGLQATTWPRMSRVLIVEVNNEQIGLLVDCVTQVRRIKPEEIERTPSLGEGPNFEHVLFVARPDDSQPVLIVDLDGILSEHI